MRKRFQFWKNEKGLAAIEFAFVAPVMISMLLGLVELSQALLVRADVTNMASTGADLIAQESTVTTADMSNVFNALSAMLYPADPTKAKIVLTSIKDNGTNGASGTVAWTCSFGGSDPHTIGQTMSLPQPSGGSSGSSSLMMSSGGSLILAEITYSYNSPISYFLTGTRVLTNNFYSHPRQVLQIPMSGGCPPSS
jgi:Flp pilus assembly protein TadG